MKLIVHIGTQITGTTSIQNYCRKNKKALEKKGILYPLFGDSFRNHNDLALFIAKNHMDDAKARINRILKVANNKNIQTILISAEMFFAMGIELNYSKDKDLESCINNEKKQINNFYLLLNNFCKIELHCFLRRQDLFIESYYSQRIKNSHLDCDIYKFIQMSNNLLDYYKIMSIWSDVFGESNINVHSYDFNSNAIIEYFMENVLNINDSSDFTEITKQTNKSPSRELIEFKRILNKLNKSKSEHFIATKAIKNISQRLNSYTKACYLTNRERIELLKKYNKGNEYIENNYLKNDEKLFVNVTENTSDALTELDNNKLIAIMIMYNSYVNKLLIKTEIHIRNILRRLIQFSPIFNRLLQPVRIIVYYYQKLSR